MSKFTNGGLTRSHTVCFMVVPRVIYVDLAVPNAHMATVGVKWLSDRLNSDCLSSDGKLFQSWGAAAANVLSPKELRDCATDYIESGFV